MYYSKQHPYRLWELRVVVIVLNYKRQARTKAESSVKIIDCPKQSNGLCPVFFDWKSFYDCVPAMQTKFKTCPSSRTNDAIGRKLIISVEMVHGL